MRERRYRFLTTWLLEAPREAVFEAIWDAARWPEWWPGVISAVETDPGSETGVGRRGSYVWRSRIPYPVSFDVVATRIERPWLLEGRASGDLEGVGRWRLFSEAGQTAALYEWDVGTTKPWMNLIAPLAGPIFRWNHEQLMQAGGTGLAGHLDMRRIL